MSADVNLLHSLDEFERLAVAAMPNGARLMVQGASGDGWTLADNRDAWRRLTLRPRALVDVSNRELTATILGEPVSMPVLIAPSACMGWYMPTANAPPARPPAMPTR